jgi:CRP-like cAMP-binding protein
MNKITQDNFIKAVRSITPIPDEQIAKVLSISYSKKITKGDCYIREGEIPKSFAYVVKGLFRYYYIDKKGNDFTKGFFPENSFIASYSALIHKRGSYFTVEALENSNILVINYNEWKEIFEKELCWHKFLLALIEKGYCIKEAREREFLLFDAEERYKSFLKNFPGLDKRIKQHIIASYLGITSVALSRIRKKMNLVNIG